jgi:hypothetical protein
VGAGRGAHRSGHAFYTQSVLSTLSDAEPELAQAIARRLPDGQDLFSSLDQGVTPRGSGVPTGMNPQLLEPDDRTELGVLAGWDGDQRRLRRTVVIPPACGPSAMPSPAPSAR